MGPEISKVKFIESRFYVKFKLKDILRNSFIDFELYRPDMDLAETTRIAESLGVSVDHPNFELLAQRIRLTFTIGEIVILMSTTLFHGGIDARKAVLKISKQVPRKLYRMTVQRSDESSVFDFSKIEGYAVPFNVMGRYDASQNRLIIPS